MHRRTARRVPADHDVAVPCKDMTTHQPPRASQGSVLRKGGGGAGGRMGRGAALIFTLPGTETLSDKPHRVTQRHDPAACDLVHLLMEVRLSRPTKIREE